MSGKEYRMGKRECEEAGKVWVDSYRKRKTDVKGYCRDRKKGEKIERKEIRKRIGQGLEGYYEGTGPDPLEAISEILREMDLPYNGGGDEIEYELPNGEYTSDDSEVEKYDHVDFQTTVYKDGKYYSFGGTVSKDHGKWVAGGESSWIKINID